MEMTCCGYELENLFVKSKIEDDSFKDEKGVTNYFKNELEVIRIPKCVNCGDKIRFNDLKQIL